MSTEPTAGQGGQHHWPTCQHARIPVILQLRACEAANRFSMGDAMARLSKPCPLLDAKRQTLSAATIDALEAAVTG